MVIRGVPPDGIYLVSRRFAPSAARSSSRPELPKVPSAVPVPEIIGIGVRPGASLVDIEYRVAHPTAEFIDTGILVFTSGEADDLSFRGISHFVEGTSTNIGTHVPANKLLHLVWDASEIVTNFADLHFEILAQDGSGLIPAHFITLPNDGAQPKLTMTAQEVTDADLMSVWAWLVATGSPQIVKEGQTIFRLNDHTALASGNSTSAAGREFIFKMLGWRTPTDAEVSRANAGKYGFGYGLGGAAYAVTLRHAVKID
jgi:hypothetical protein